MRPLYEVADILQSNIGQINKLTANSWQARTLYALACCRTHLLGGHIDKCTNPNCTHLHLSYNSCRNRHCPKCQGHKREEWIHARESELLNVPYYHVVFTLPAELNTVCLYAPEIIYALLFKTVWSVISGFAANPKFLGAKTGMVAILHTWGQNLALHPHLHCIVPGGGVSPQIKWIHARGKGKYLFPAKAMSTVFRARFVEGLRKQTELDGALYKRLFEKNWVVYCKRPFIGPAQVVEYLGRYTHKIAISNHHIKNIENGNVTFTAKDYRHGGKIHPVVLTDKEFVRRFAQHILPKGFTRIRHYGILSSSQKKVVIPVLQKLMGEAKLQKKPPLRHRACPVCKTGELVTLITFNARGPPTATELRALLQHSINTPRLTLQW
jgi:hypothetical protein